MNKINALVTYTSALIVTVSGLFCTVKKDTHNIKSDVPSEFMKYVEPTSKKEGFLQTGFYVINRDEIGKKMSLDKSDEVYYINPMPIVTYRNIEELKVEKHYQGYMQLLMKLDEEGTNLWEEGARKNVDEQVGFILNDNLIFKARLTPEIEGPWTGIFGPRYNEEEYTLFKHLIEMNKK